LKRIAAQLDAIQEVQEIGLQVRRIVGRCHTVDARRTPYGEITTSTAMTSTHASPNHPTLNASRLEPPVAVAWRRVRQVPLTFRTAPPKVKIKRDSLVLFYF
jgi:hypothetical protein